jgi:hypothetical protein
VPISDANEPVLARTQPADRPPRTLDDPGAGPSARRAGDPLHRLCVGGLRGAELGRKQGARRCGDAADRDAFDHPPVDQAAARFALGVAPDNRRGGTERRADQEPRLPDSIVAP